MSQNIFDIIKRIKEYKGLNSDATAYFFSPSDTLNKCFQSHRSSRKGFYVFSSIFIYIA